jgi:hypothetical protein
MAAKQVTQFDCDRCQRTWYSGANSEAPNTHVLIEADIEGTKVSVKQDCLCEGCRSTVRGLLEAIGKTITKASPIRTAKKKGKKGVAAAAAEDKPPAAATTSTPTPATPRVVVVPSAQSPVARSGAAAAHPTR